ncbi:hypothetical protein HPB51_015699 [Rhipicephalus microplus]|uniref:THAP-type domain-containing protein n=1 Tax=Rhipicephalus microplus TaxID=6941 RepID=A0A9J6D5P6_RHIMP|nr:hypothetical protein HPB51_015699 [Rhipicephalus microplus]
MPEEFLASPQGYSASTEEVSEVYIDGRVGGGYSDDLGMDVAGEYDHINITRNGDEEIIICTCSRDDPQAPRCLWCFLLELSDPPINPVFRFPRSQPHLYQQWVVNLKRDKWKPSPGSRLCSSHFTEARFDRSGSRTRLKSDAIPMLFSFPEHLQKAVNPAHVAEKTPTATRSSEQAADSKGYHRSTGFYKTRRGRPRP